MMPPHTAIEKLEIHQCTQDITLPALQTQVDPTAMFQGSGFFWFWARQANNAWHHSLTIGSIGYVQDQGIDGIAMDSKQMEVT